MTNTNFINQLASTWRKGLTLLYNTTHDPNTQKQIIKINNEIQHQLDEETNYIQYEGVIRQRFLNALAGDIAITDLRREWFLYKAVTMIVATEEFDLLLHKIYQIQYQPLKNRLYQIGTIVEELKYHYDMMEQNPKDTNKYKHHNQEVNKRITRLPLISEELNTLLYIISTKTNLGQYTVPQVAISKISQEYKKTEIQEERKMRPEPERPEGG